MAERDDITNILAGHRHLFRFTAEGLTEEQARSTPTVSELSIASLLKHVADTEAGWIQFARHGAMERTWDPEVGDTRFVLSENDTVENLLARYDEVAADTTAFITTADLDEAHPLPDEPWFTPGVSWTVRTVLLHVLAETSQHAGHADIIREAIDGQKTMG